MKNKSYLNNSYHTHNYRCKHADGGIDDYVKEASRLGFSSIGFTDHVPFKDDRISGMRMYYKELEGYLQDIEEAREKFKNIKIYSGLECEYFRNVPGYYEELLEKVDYLILGQHFVERENGYFYIGDENFLTEGVLIEYVDYIEEAFQTGHFSLLAHPDLYGLANKEVTDVTQEVVHRIAQLSIQYDVPLEINANGFRRGSQHFHEGYPYPLKSFWEIIAKDYPEVKVVITPDAHRIEDLSDEANKMAFDFASSLGLKATDHLELKRK